MYSLLCYITFLLHLVNYMSNCNLFLYYTQWLCVLNVKHTRNDFIGVMVCYSNKYIKPVPKTNSNITTTEGICQHGWEHHAEWVGGYGTTLLDAIGHMEWQWELSIILHSAEHAIIELADQNDELLGQPNFMTFSSWHFSCSCLVANIISTVPCPLQKPHWHSGSKSCSRCCVR